MTLDQHELVHLIIHAALWTGVAIGFVCGYAVRKFSKEGRGA